jgi:lipoprotein-anchoring transpeptidase ErfK/SrfK
MAPAVALAALLLLASCGGVGSESSSTTTTAVPVAVTATPPADAQNVQPDQVVTISVSDGTIAAVTINSTAGYVTGDLSADDTSWQSSTALVPSTTYQVAASLVDSLGGTADQHWSFTTGAASKVFRAVVSPGDGKVVGVGMPVTVKLNTPVPKANRPGFEKLLTVTSVPAAVGAWHWFSDTELHWRPKDYWPAGAQVKVNAAIAGYAAGDGAYGAKNVTTNYKIGDSHVSVVDVNTHKMTVSTNGVVAKVVDVSTGRDQFPTHGGIHVASEKDNPKVMDSSTIGIPRDGAGGYYEVVPWSVRISNSGEFVHAASWSTGAQGNSNVSHGCVNVSPADGEWFYNYTQLGDVVQVNGSPIQLEPTNGIGDWQIPWAQWAN